MTPFLAKWVWFAGLIALQAIRYPHERRARRTATARKIDWRRDRLRLAATVLGLMIVPAIYVVFGRPAFADYPFQPVLAWLGVLALSLSLYVFYRAHRDLGRNWSVALEVRERHSLVTTGIYRQLRHPMYSSFLLLALAQVLLLPNWIAGPAGLAGFAAMYFGRVRHEERMMLETFGDDYRRYMARTSRIIPGIF